MKETQPGFGRTRWRRFAVVIVPSFAAVAGMLFAMSTGALAASFSVSQQDFKVSADSLDGTGFVQYGWIDQQADGTVVPVAVSAIKHATLKNMCQSVLTTLPIVGDISLKLSAGTGSTPVTADDLFIDMSQLDGDATFTSIQIGQDASTLDKGPASAQGLQGGFGQQATQVHIDHLRQVAWASNAGTFKLAGLHMGITGGKDECF
jgi:Family of unknown function (DUF6230)